MPLVACPECGRQISDRAPACPHCGLPMGCVVAAPGGPPAAVQVGFAAAELLRSPLQEIAYRQKLLMYAVLINILCQLPVWYFLESPWLAPLGWLIIIAQSSFSIWCFWMLGRAMRWPWPLLAFLTLWLFFPLVSLLLLVSISVRATKALKKAGVRVGLMGADLSKVP